MPSNAGRSLRLAHITDVHVQPELGAARGLAQCLHHVQSQPDAPQLILNTGDSIMDAIEAGADRTELQWNLWQKLLRDECSLPLEHAIGNHDCWGLNRTKSGTTGREPRWGKQWALEGLGLASPYRSFDRAGWHFIVLDSIEPYQDTYRARLGAEQLDWLKTDLASVPKGVPILVLGHIPIVSPGAVLNGVKETPDHNLELPGALTHLDAKPIHDLLRRQGNVKLCLSGHLHLVDRAEYDGITYISTGAVSASWWKGIRLERFDYGYALVDLFKDGTFHYQFVSYGWRTVASEG
ncbi:MAG: metallophosphoesterase [Verrucomicrobia bacterium]|nr:metallophosphoesterase [Verrucomicrobiota bacterium]